MKAPTIKDVAAYAKVSTATVSRVLNNIEGFSDETRQIVLDAIEALGYRRNDLARNLKTNTSHTLALISPVLNPMFSAKMAANLQAAAAVSGYTLMPLDAGSNAENIRYCLDQVRANQYAGTFLLSVPLTKFTDKPLHDFRGPLVSVMSCFDSMDVPFVCIDNFHAAYQATAHLIERGHRRIALVCGQLNDETAHTRYDGFRKAIEDASLTVSEELLVFDNFTYESGRASFRKILSRSRDFTAVVCCSDDLAAGVIYEAKLAGIDVPSQVSVTGFDNTAFAEMSCPPLTSYAIPFEQISRYAMDLMTMQIEMEKKPAGITIAGNLVCRESVRDIRT